MYKLNYLQYPEVKDINIKSIYSLEPLKDNEICESKIDKLKKKFDFIKLNTFSFSKDGFLSLMLNLKGKIAVSLGESEAIVSAAKQLKNRGFLIDFIKLNKNGTLDLSILKYSNYDYIFVSAYCMDTFLRNDLKQIKLSSNAKIISNVYATLDCTYVDIALFDSYKLTGYATSSLILHNNELEEQYLGEIDTVAINLIYNSLNEERTNFTQKVEFINALKNELHEDVFFFVKPELTLYNSLHIGLKGIKAREIIRTLSLSSIYVSNGEGCSLGLSKPSRIIQEMGYKELESRQALSLSFSKDLEDGVIKMLAKKIAKAYRQIKALNE